MTETTTDHISDLPESVLFHILSFLPTKYVVQMSILSRRWRYLWTSVPTLDFDEDLFQLQTLSSGGSLVDANKRFVDFVNKVLQLHDMSHIQRFCITCYYLDNSFVSEWIGAAVKKNMQELYLIILKSVVELPDCLFTCKSLVSLKLAVPNGILKVPTSVNFTRLREIHLFSVALNGSFGKLISSCPVLESMAMIGCRCSDAEVVNISSPTLKYLNMSCASFPGIKISSPNLVWFKYSSCLGKNCFLENLSSLMFAYIDVKIDNKYCSTRYTECFHNVRKLLRGVSNTRSLALSNSTLEQLSNAPNLLESLSSFHNLFALKLNSLRKRKYFRMIAYLLQSFPVLNYLFIDIKPSPDVVYEEDGEESESLCLEGLLHAQLKEVKMKCFGGTEEELEFVKLLLSSASTMKRVIIVEEKGLEKRTQVREKFLMFQRASARCNISFS